MIPALVLACALHRGMCATTECRRITDAIDRATDSDELRAIEVVFVAHESGCRLNPRPESWDSRAGLAVGPFQFWRGIGLLPLDAQARIWLRDVQHGGLAGMCGYGAAARRIAYSRAREAERLLAGVKLTRDA